MLNDLLERLKDEWIIGLCLPHIVRSLDTSYEKEYSIQTLLALNFEEKFNFSSHYYEGLFSFLKNKFIVFGHDIPIDYQPYINSILLYADKNRLNSNIALESIDHNNHIRKALSLIQSIDEHSHRVIHAHMLCLISVKCVRFQSTSIPKMLGAIFLNAEFFKHELDTALSIIHETAHQELFLINMIDSLVEKCSQNEMVYSSLQKSERPPIGRLHSCHALYRMIKFQGLWNNPVDDLKITLQNTLKTFKKTSLTNAGRYLIDNIYPTVI
ncbi:MAG: hypothetical protein CMP47_02950 [Rickettsiales bacterium]|nr:hypothetical protein [Rickettsiales bacterium]